MSDAANPPIPRGNAAKASEATIKVLGPVMLVPGWASFKDPDYDKRPLDQKIEHRIGQTETVAWTGVTLAHWAPPIAKALGAGAPAMGTIATISQGAGKIVAPLLWVSAVEQIYNMKQYHTAQAKWLGVTPLADTLAFAAAPTVSLLGAGAETTAAVGEYSNPIGWIILGMDQAAGKYELWAHPEFFKDQGAVRKWSSGIFSQAIDAYESLDAAQREYASHFIASPSPLFYPVSAETSPKLYDYVNLYEATNLVFGENRPAYLMDDKYREAMAKHDQSWQLKKDVDLKHWKGTELENGIQDALNKAHIEIARLESNYSWHQDMWNNENDDNIEKQINAIQDHDVALFQGALDEIRHQKGPDENDKWMGFNQREQQYDDLKAKYTEWLKKHPDVSKYDSSFLDSLDRLNELRSQGNTHGVENLDAPYFDPDKYDKEGDDKYTWKPGANKEPVTVNDMIVLLMTSRNHAQILEMEAFKKGEKGARSPQQILNDNKELAAQLGLDSHATSAMLITSPEQLELALQTSKRQMSDGSLHDYDMTADFGIASPVIQDAFALALKQGRMKLEPGGVVVWEKDRGHFNFKGDTVDYNALNDQITASMKKLPAPNDANYADVFTRSKSYYNEDKERNSWVKDALKDHAELKPFMDRIQGMIYDGTAPKNAGDLVALLQNLKTIQDRTIEHPSLSMSAEALDQHMQHYDLIQNGDPKSPPYKMTLEDVKPFLTPQMQSDLEKTAVKSHPTESHADAMQQFRDTMQNANMTTPENLALSNAKNAVKNSHSRDA